MDLSGNGQKLPEENFLYFKKKKPRKNLNFLKGKLFLYFRRHLQCPKNQHHIFLICFFIFHHKMHTFILIRIFYIYSFLEKKYA